MSWRKSELLLFPLPLLPLLGLWRLSGPNLSCVPCFRVDMKHRYRRDLVKGEAESTMTKQKLQQRMREQ